MIAFERTGWGDDDDRPSGGCRWYYGSHGGVADHLETGGGDTVEHDDCCAGQSLAEDLSRVARAARGELHRRRRTVSRLSNGQRWQSDSQGNLYGTTSGGGVNSYEAGVVFKIVP